MTRVWNYLIQRTLVGHYLTRWGGRVWALSYKTLGSPLDCTLVVSIGMLARNKINAVASKVWALSYKTLGSPLGCTLVVSIDMLARNRINAVASRVWALS